MMKSHTAYLTFHVPERMGFVNITRQVESELKASGMVAERSGCW